MHHNLSIDTDNISKIISLLRFPLAFFVVMIHCNMGGYKFPIFNYSLQNIIFLAVPLFYIISGYNFIKSKKSYQQKLKDRLKTLFVPYLLWNIIAYFVSIRHNGVYLPNWNVLILNPIDFPLWYIRDLFMLSLLTPIIYPIITKFKGVIFIIISSLLYIYEYKFPIIGLRYNSIFFYGIGMLLFRYLETKDFSIHISLYCEFLIHICSFILFIISIELRETLFHVDGFCFAVYIIFATISILFILLRFNKKINVYQFPFNQGDKSFFIYCSHCILISGFSVYLLNKTCLYSELKIFISAIISVSICILLYNILKRFTPTLLKSLNGGRI